MAATGQNAAVRRRVKRVRKKFSWFSVRSGIDMPLLVLVFALLGTGLIMLFSASFAYSLYQYGSSTMFIAQQARFALLGVVAMLVISYFDYHHLHKFMLPIAGATVLMLLMVLVLKGTPLAPVINGANRWLNIGIQFQPSEIAKFALILALAHIIAANYDRMHTLREGFAEPMGVIMLFAGLIIAEKHVSATVIIALIGVLMMFVGGTKIRYFLPFGALGGGVLAYLVFFSDKFAYALARIQGWLDPFNPPEGIDTWQTQQSLYAIGSGRFFGVGLGQSRQKYLWLPEPQNDFIFAIICEELGFIGAIAIILLFAAFVWRGVTVSLAAKDRFGMMLGLGITFQVGVQAVLNIMVVTNTIPNTGISLPFFSYGGTQLLILLAEMGVLLSVSRSSNIEKN